MSNPFSSLNDSAGSKSNSDTRTNLSKLYEEILNSILQCTVDEDTTSPAIYLSQLANNPSIRWNKSTIDEALFERLRLENPSIHLLNKSKLLSEEIKRIAENRCLNFLATCYQRLIRYRDRFQPIYDEMIQLFVDHLKTALTVPEIYEGQDMSQQWLDVLIDSIEITPIEDLVKRIHSEIFPSLADELEPLFKKIFVLIYKRVNLLDYYSNELMSYVTLMDRLAPYPNLVKLIFRISYPSQNGQRSVAALRSNLAQGRGYEDTLIGVFLSKSCLPNVPGQPFLFFDKPRSLSEREIELTESTMCQPMRLYQERLSNLFLAFVKNSDARSHVLKWIGDCLVDNKGKNKEWSAHNPLTALSFASDGFLLNLNVILLNLALPFSEPYSPKLLKIHPLYPISKSKNVHLKGLSTETPLINRDDDKLDATSDDFQFHFITEIFFMTHQSYSCSAQRMHRTLLKLNEELSRIRSAYNDAVQSFGQGHESAQRLEDAMTKGLTAFLNIRAVLNETRLLELSNSFFSGTASWLVHLASCFQVEDYDKSIRIPQKLPLTSVPIRYLSYVPEFLVENISNYLSFLGRFNHRMFQNLMPPVDEYVTFILVFMGDARRLKNPHLRAGLAEALEAILPNKNGDQGRMTDESLAERIFKTHPLIESLACVLLDVFVSIELTGQAVAFEQKFNYRRPMYEILEYMWSIEQHRFQVKKLAKYAEEHIDDAEAPLFLRFINLLMNDANYLLDEALSKMALLRENEETMSRAEWNDLPQEQRQTLQTSYRHTGQGARYTNFMGRKTLTIIELITRENQFIFCQGLISGRLAAMLNYFLQHLVGPKRRNLRVRDLKEYEFDPPKLVAKVTDIYLNFSGREKFYVAVCNDAMSYNKQLFPQAVEVLERIGHPKDRIDAFIKLGKEIESAAMQQEDEDLVYDDAPDDYLDPITSTLMVDPVMLPTSRKIMDRSTIARHLLSDQTDPFNRNPLKMQDVIPQPELKKTIEQWKASKREKT